MKGYIKGKDGRVLMQDAATKLNDIEDGKAPLPRMNISANIIAGMLRLTKKEKRAMHLAKAWDILANGENDTYQQKAFKILQDKGIIDTKLTNPESILDSMSKITMEILSKDDNEFFQAHNVDGQTIYTANMIRYPHQRVGQSFFCVINSITPRTIGFEIDDFYYRNILGGDYDGDVCQLIGVSKKALEKSMNIHFPEYSTATSLSTLGKLSSMYEGVVQLEKRYKGVTFNGDDSFTHYTSPGVAIAIKNDAT